MRYLYDAYGWFCGTTADEDAPRSTEIEPPQAVGNQRPNFTGVEWVLVGYVAPVPIPVFREPRQWSPGRFASFLTSAEWGRLQALAKTDDLANQFQFILTGLDYVQEDDPMLDRAFQYFLYTGVTTRTKEEVLG